MMPKLDQTQQDIIGCNDVHVDVMDTSNFIGYAFWALCSGICIFPDVKLNSNGEYHQLVNVQEVPCQRNIIRNAV